MSSEPIDEVALLDEAQKRYLLFDEATFSFGLRQKKQFSQFYAELDRYLRRHRFLKITATRDVKEGFAKVARPSEIGFTLVDLLRERPLVKAIKTEWQRVCTDFAFCSILDFLQLNYAQVMNDLGNLRPACEILQYLLDHREKVQGLYLRQIAHGQSTKLIGKNTLLLRLFAFWRQEPLTEWDDFYRYFQIQILPTEFRYYASEVTVQGHALKNHHGVLFPIGDAPIFANNRATILVENLQSFFALTELDLPQPVLVVWGAGWRVAGLAPWLNSLPRPLLYWGDMDKEGFEIFGLVARHSPDTIPLLMGESELIEFGNLVQKKEPYLGPLANLPLAQQGIYQRVARSGDQIEQEQLPLARVKQRLAEILKN